MWNTLLQNTGIISLIITIAAIGLLPIICALLWKGHCKENVSFRPLLFGVAGFLLYALILKLGNHILGSTGIIRSTIVYSIMTGVVEELIRYVIIRYTMKKDKTKENMVMYGIGHGGIEIWSTTLLSLASLLIIIIMGTRGMESDILYFLITAGVTPTPFAEPMMKFILAAGTSFNIGIGMLYVFEKLIGMFFQIDFTILIAYGIMKHKKKYLPLAILVHVIVNMMHTMLIMSSWAWYLLLSICVVILTVWARRLYKQMVVIE
ncbi:MAG: YhfC family intramembrane metalloprotease [Lachnospiraceae bacterium]|nr:YhfC family intramembrane metalloprotease [Lachnospiraceae bacterium]